MEMNCGQLPRILYVTLTVGHRQVVPDAFAARGGRDLPGLPPPLLAHGRGRELGKPNG